LLGVVEVIGMVHQVGLVILLLVEELLMLVSLLLLSMNLLEFKFVVSHHMGICVHALGNLRGH
jgi:hypothetical protein